MLQTNITSLQFDFQNKRCGLLSTEHNQTGIFKSLDFDSDCVNYIGI